MSETEKAPETVALAPAPAEPEKRTGPVSFIENFSTSRTSIESDFLLEKLFFAVIT